MKALLFSGLFFLAASFITGFSYRSYEWFPILLATILGYAFARIGTLNQHIQNLSSRLDTLEHAANNKEQTSTTEERTTTGTINSDEPESKASTAEPVTTNWKWEAETTEKEEQASPTKATPSYQDDWQPITKEQPEFIQKALSYITNYFTGGNLFVRIGILLLFFGVSFLLRYVSDKGLFPIEYRLMSTAIGSIALLIFGWRLREKKTTYSLLIQGAAIGILYLTIFAAFSLYHLLEPLPAFALLLTVSLFTAALAVLQNSQSLAFLGFAGGFLAPILASSGSNNHVGLFSYYIILNLALLAVAWFKAWRPLNLLGFLFTFIVGGAWGVSSYNPEKFSTTEPFLIVFFLMYVAIAVLFALRQPPKLKGYVDGSLLFGVPLAASAMQYAIIKDVEYGVAFSSLAMGAFYLLLAWGIWKKAGEQLRLLAEAFLALGIIFSSLAIPFALAPAHTAAAWGLEGMGLIWLGSRQNRLSVRSFGLLLYAAAGFFVLFHHRDLEALPFVNSQFISYTMMAIASILSAFMLYKPFAGRKSWEETLSPLLLIAGLIWLFNGFGQQISRHYGSEWLTSSIILLAAIVSIAFVITAKRSKPEWQHAWYLIIGLLAIMSFGLISNFNGSVQMAHAPSNHGGWLTWPLAFIALYWCYRQLDLSQSLVKYRPILHIGATLLLITGITWEGAHFISHTANISNDWLSVWFATPSLLGLWAILKAKVWPFSHHEDAYLIFSSSILSVVLLVWSVFSFSSSGDAAPLPWLPLLNPLDITLGLILVTLFNWWQRIQHHEQLSLLDEKLPMAVIGISGLLAFAWLNITIYRLAHHHFGISYSPDALFDSALVQSSMSILWAFTGVILTIVASRKQWRNVWFIGGTLLLLVVAKLFLIDLSEIGTLARIVSFLVVGLLLTSIGYFAPLPETTEQTLKEEDASHV